MMIGCKMLSSPSKKSRRMTRRYLLRGSPGHQQLPWFIPEFAETGFLLPMFSLNESVNRLMPFYVEKKPGDSNENFPMGTLINDELSNSKSNNSKSNI